MQNFCRLPAYQNPKNISRWKLWLKRYRVSLNMMLAVITAATGLTYLFAVNSMATQGLAMKKLQKQLQQIERQNKKIMTTMSSARSLATLEAKIVTLNMVPVENISIIETGSSAVALR